jgi:GNAT superfamily N-acetyltransferase
MTKFRVEFISAEDTLDLRMKILRPGQAREFCMYPEDHLPTTFHLGILENGRVISNGTFIQQKHELFAEEGLTYRLRGMASDSAFQKKGLGKSVLQAAETELKRRGCSLLWFNARTSAEGFYKKSGYIPIEKVFEITGIGPHKVMYKKLF